MSAQQNLQPAEAVGGGHDFQLHFDDPQPPDAHFPETLLRLHRLPGKGKGNIPLRTTRKSAVQQFNQQHQNSVQRKKKITTPTQPLQD